MNGLSCGFDTWYGGRDGRGTCVKHRSPDIVPYLNSPGKTKIMLDCWCSLTLILHLMGMRG